MRNAQATTQTRCKRENLIQQSIQSMGDCLVGYTFEACISERVEFDEGSSGTRAVVEVVVLAAVVEVVVHGRRGSSRSWRR